MSMLVGCGVTGDELAGDEADLAQDTAELSTKTPTLVLARRDYRKCSYPMCSGWYVKDLNGNGREQYVTGFDFRRSGLNLATRDLVTGAGGDGELVLSGVLAPNATYPSYQVFQVRAAYRGMPGKKPAANEKFYAVEETTIRCITAPCATLRATEANYPGRQTMVNGIDVERASVPRLDQTWLTSRIEKHDAIVSAKFTTVRRVGVGTEKLVDASQVFVKLPSLNDGCPLARPAACPGTQLRVWERNEDRCLAPTSQCVPQRACGVRLAACAEGYTPVSWQGTGPCQESACDPSFAVRP
ncbi:MAG: hypothetical protein JNG84_15415 [Archangium sp.]|nr:hypothetical protein [Archangium sp.]